MAEIQLILPFIFIMMSLYIGTYFFKRDPFILMAPILISITLFIYLFSIFGLYKIAVYLVVMIVVVGFIFSLIKGKFKNDSFYQMNTLYIVLLIIFLVIWNRERYFYQWDEFMHWGLMVKEILRLDDLYSIDASHLIFHKDYPPIIPLFESFWLNISRTYSEPLIYQTLQFFGFSMILSFFAEKKNNILSFIVVFILLVFYQGFFDLEDAKFFLTIYLDPILGISFAYLLYLIYKDDGSCFSTVLLILSGSFLVLVKEMGAFLFVLAFAFWFVHQFFKGFKKEQLKKYLFQWVIPVLCFVSWKIYFSQFNYVGQFQPSSFDIKILFEIIKGTGGLAWQQEAYTNYVNSLSTMYLLRKPFEINHYSMNLLFIGLSILISLLISKQSRKQWLFSSITLVVLSNLYAFVMLLLYIFSFGEYEGVKLASNLRYMSTFWYALGLFFIMVWFTHVKTTKKMIIHSSTWILIVVSFFYNEQNYMRIEADLNYDNFEIYFTQDTNRLRTETEVDSKIYLITQNYMSNYLNYFRYLVNDRVFNVDGYNIGTTGKYDQWDYTQEEFLEAVSVYDYLYIYSIDDEFYERFFKIMPDNFYLENHQLLKINNINGEVSFEVLFPE